MKRLTQLLRSLIQNLRPQSSGWASQTLLESIRHTVLVLTAAWQGVMVIAVFMTLGSEGWLLAVAHAALGLVMLFARHNPKPALLAALPLAMSALAAISLMASDDIDSVLVFASAWLSNSASIAAGLLVLSAWIAPVVVLLAILVSGSVAWYQPQWGSELPTAILVTMPAIIVVVRLSMPLLLAFAAESDKQNARAERAANEAEVRRRISLLIAENARVLHDTAINTFAFIANWRAGIADAQQIREQCARDVDVLVTLSEGQSQRGLTRQMFDDVVQLTSGSVQRIGMSDDEILAVTENLDPELVDAAWGATREALTNIAKHANATSAQLDIRLEDDFIIVEISDTGVGFDGTIPEGRGLANSVLGRAHDYGFKANIATEFGAGTTITLKVPLKETRTSDAVPPIEPPATPTVVVATMHRRAGLLWGIGVTLVSGFLTLTVPLNHEMSMLIMIGVMTISVIVGLAVSKPGVSWLAAVVLTFATPVTFYLSVAATDFGSSNAVHWQALAATAPFIILMSYRPPRAILVVGLILWLCSLGIAVELAVSTNAQLVVFFGGAVGLLFTWGWTYFSNTAASMASRTALARQQEFRDQVRANAERATQDLYRIWVEAALESASILLQDIATGKRDPHDPTTHAICAREEHYLRQLVLLSPDLIYLGAAALPVLREAHDKEFPLTMRFGGLDADSEETAELFLKIVRIAMARAQAEQAVSASVFPTQRGLQLTIVGPVLERTDLADVPVHFEAEFDNLGASGITRVTCVHAPDDSASTSGSSSSTDTPANTAATSDTSLFLDARGVDSSMP